MHLTVCLVFGGGGREGFYLFIFLCTFGKTSCYIENIQFYFNSPDGQPLSKKALKKLQKDAEKAAKKAEYKAANKPAQQVKIFVDKYLINDYLSLIRTKSDRFNCI